jgi:hypothetical protein
MIVHHFQNEFYHLGTDEKLLENSRLLPVFGEEQELSQKLQSAEVLQIAVAMQSVTQPESVHITIIMSSVNNFPRMSNTYDLLIDR